MAEHHHGHHEVEIFVDKKRYSVERGTMTGSELKGLAGIPQDYELWLERPGDQDKRIENNESVELKSGMKFFSVPPVINPGSRR